jgi:hypothetical protein
MIEPFRNAGFPRTATVPEKSYTRGLTECGFWAALAPGVPHSRPDESRGQRRSQASPEAAAPAVAPLLPFKRCMDVTETPSLCGSAEFSRPPASYANVVSLQPPTLRRFVRRPQRNRTSPPNAAIRSVMARWSGLRTYEEAGERLGYSPGYVRWLTRTGQLGYVVKTWRRGWLLRRKRLIPDLELAAFELQRLRRIVGPVLRETLSEMPRHRRSHRR